MTPETIAAHVAAECGPLNDTERERARRLALEFQMAAVAESYDRARGSLPLVGGGEQVMRILEALRRNPELSQRDLIDTLKVSRDSTQKAQKIWGKPLRRAGRRGPTKIGTAMAALRREPWLSNPDAAQKLGITNKTVWRARKRIENESLTNGERVSE